MKVSTKVSTDYNNNRPYITRTAFIQFMPTPIDAIITCLLLNYNLNLHAT